jgi:hypothetical protein
MAETCTDYKNKHCFYNDEISCWLYYFKYAESLQHNGMPLLKNNNIYCTTQQYPVKIAYKFYFLYIFYVNLHDGFMMTKHVFIFKMILLHNKYTYIWRQFY